GITPYTWSISAGNLPPGLTLNTGTGAITGTPTTAGPYSFTAQVTDSEASPQSVTANLSITVNAQLAISTTTLNNGIVGTAYSQTLAATGGIAPYTWSISAGNLPPGLSLNASTGAITGTPTAAGTYSFAAKVTDSESPTHSATASLSITINTKLAVQTTALPVGVLNTTYSGATLQATGGVTPYIWSWTGTTPPGLVLSGAGAISGTPTATGSYNFTVHVADSSNPQQTATANLSLTVNAQLAITTVTLNNGAVGISYNQTLTATGGITPYTWSISVGSLPAGLSLNTSTGAITGSPTTAGTSSFTAKVTDSESPNQSTTANLSITINAKLQVQTSSLPQGVISNTYPGATLQAGGGVTPYTWSISSGNLPGGLVLNTSTGAITGTPTATGTFNFTAKVVDAGTPQQSATANLSIQINGALTITTASLPSGVLNQSYNQSVAATGGLTPYTWSLTAGSLPSGLSLNTSTGAITGTPNATGTSSFTVQVSDSETPTAQTSKGLSITINNSAPLMITTSGLPTGVISTAYSNAFLGASGGTPPYTWSISSGSLPPALTLNTSTGQISGTPTSTGTYNFTAKVVDQSVPQESATANLSITINTGLTITTSSLPGGSLNNFYNQSI
ncbi:MAG: putative Ig domain-containing protein, partial [Mycobacterium sp.]